MELLKKNIIFKLPAIIIFCICLLYIVRLKYCKCSDKKERDYLKYLIIILIGFNLLTCIPNVQHIAIFILQSILQIMFVFLSIKYIKHLKKIECGCSEDWKREFMYIYSWVSIVIICLSVAIMLFSLTYIGSNISSSQNQLKLFKKNSKK